MNPCLRHILALLPLIAILARCGVPQQDTEPNGGAFRPIDPDVADLWDRQTTENAELLRGLVEEFNAGYDGLPVKIVQSGNYGDIYQKTTAAIQAGTLPAMAVAYGNMTLEYAEAEAVVDLNRFIAEPEVGLSKETLDDFFPAVLEQNRYEQFGGAMLSFPYTKAVLVMYVNENVLEEAGIEGPPSTWSEFLDQCRAVKRKTGKYALAFDVDASTINGMIFSRGGRVAENGRPAYGTPEARAVFSLLETLFAEKLAFQNPPRSFNDQTAFGENEIAFAFRPSSSLPYFRLVMEGNEGWRVTSIPQGDPSDPATVLYGANISVFRTTRAQQRASWAFLKYFTSTEVNVRWALNTGYLPYRKSAINNPRLQRHWAEWPSNRTAFDCLAYARPEPNLKGWQQVRNQLEDAVTSVITGLRSAPEALEHLQASIGAN